MGSLRVPSPPEGIGLGNQHREGKQMQKEQAGSQAGKAKERGEIETMPRKEEGRGQNPPVPNLVVREGPPRQS